MKNNPNKKLCLVLGDQLNLAISSICSINKKHDIVIMAELWDETQYVKHHKKKLVLILSAMRHFQKTLLDKGYDVIYFKLNDKLTYRSFTEVIKVCIAKYDIEEIVVTHPGEYRILKEIKSWNKSFKVPVTILDDNRFISTPTTFEKWASARQQLRMEYFYRELRKKHNILMKRNQPIGGKWNFDTENRKSANPKLTIPKPKKFKPDAITTSVIKFVNKKFHAHFGDAEPFNYAVNRQQALKVLQHFIEKNLPDFGTYQDAMLENQPWMFHAHISFYLNCGLLLPLECIKKAEAAYSSGKAPLNAVEGFIRQILGWREYVYGFYWYAMPKYQKLNFFSSKRKSPNFYWTAKTQMNCLHQCIKDTKYHAYAHHIQRLMVIGNFALLTGLAPKEVNEWFMIVYADAYEWVELPNVMGMTLFADGGMLASKPYAAGGNYIDKMSNYCNTCHFDVKQKTGEQACPFNYLYWDFLSRNKNKLKSNQRMALSYNTWEKMQEQQKSAIRKCARKFLRSEEMQ